MGGGTITVVTARGRAPTSPRRWVSSRGVNTRPWGRGAPISAGPTADHPPVRVGRPTIRAEVRQGSAGAGRRTAVDLAFSDEPPVIEATRDNSRDHTDEKAVAPVAVGVSDIPEEGPPVERIEGTADPEAVADRFVRDFTVALTRGDTGALSDLVSPDYSGAAGGANRAALLRGVADFFREGERLRWPPTSPAQAWPTAELSPR